MPVLTPPELGRRCGRSGSGDLRPQGPNGPEFILPLTHEETVTFHARGARRAIRELPQLWYHFQTKDRDEPRRAAAFSGYASSS